MRRGKPGKRHPLQRAPAPRERAKNSTWDANQVTIPWSAQVGIVDGCNRHCSFCGLSGIKPGAAKGVLYMDEPTVQLMCEGLADLCPNLRIEYALHGEPTMHPRFFEIVAQMRAYLPGSQLTLTTNGRAWMKHFEKRAMAGFEHGLDIVIVDTYEPERERLKAKIKACTRFPVIDYYADGMAESDPMWPWRHHGTRGRKKVSGVVVILDTIVEHQVGGKRVLLNHAGSSADAKSGKIPVPREPLPWACDRPFRDLNICWDGSVNLCCVDFGHEYKCGNLHEQSLRDIWYGERFTAARKFLKRKNRGFSPCNRCDSLPGTLLGLLPDLGEPTAQDVRIIEETLAGGPSRAGLERVVLPQVRRYAGGDDD